MTETSNSIPTPIVGIQPTQAAAVSDWYEVSPSWMPGPSALTFAAFTEDGSRPTGRPFYFEIQVNGYPTRCEGKNFRVDSRESPGKWRVVKTETDQVLGLMIFGYGKTASSND